MRIQQLIATSQVATWRWLGSNRKVAEFSKGRAQPIDSTLPFLFVSPALFFGWFRVLPGFWALSRSTWFLVLFGFNSSLAWHWFPVSLDSVSCLAWRRFLSCVALAPFLARFASLLDWLGFLPCLVPVSCSVWLGVFSCLARFLVLLGVVSCIAWFDILSCLVWFAVLLGLVLSLARRLSSLSWFRFPFCLLPSGQGGLDDKRP